jgi:hypothetical protein
MKKLNRKDFIFGDQSKAELTKLPGQINNNSFLCRNLTDCEVYLCDKIGTIYIDDCIRCKFYLGPVTTSIFMRGCSDSQVSVAAQQVRISDSKNITALLFSQTQTTLENVTGLVIGPYNFAYSGIEAHFEGQAFTLTNNMAFKVMDFTPSEESWRIMKADEFPGQRQRLLPEIEQNAVNPVPVPVYYGGDLDYDIFKIKQVSEEDVLQDEEGMMSFKISVGIDEAQKRANTQMNCASNSKVPESEVRNDDKEHANKL